MGKIVRRHPASRPVAPGTPQNLHDPAQSGKPKQPKIPFSVEVGCVPECVEALQTHFPHEGVKRCWSEEFSLLFVDKNVSFVAGEFAS